MKKLLIAIIVIALGVGVVYFLPSILLTNKTIVQQEVHTLFKGAELTLDTITERAIQYNLNKDAFGIEGNISFESDYKNKNVDLTKLKDYQISYNGIIDKENNQGSISLKLDGKENIINLKAIQKDKELLLDLGDLYDKVIYTQTSKEIKDIEISSITSDDIKILVNKTEEVTKNSLKNLEIKETKEEKEINGKKSKYKKISYKMDMTDYINKLITAYKEDKEVVDVLARLTNTKEKDVEENLDNILNDLKYREKEEAIVNLYLDGIIPKAREIEFINDNNKIIIDIENNLYKYKLLVDKKELATGSYDLDKSIFTLKTKYNDTDIDVNLNLKNENHLTGTIKLKHDDENLNIDLDLKDKKSGKSYIINLKANLNYQEGENKFKFIISSENKINLDAKVEEINNDNKVDLEELSEEDKSKIIDSLFNKIEDVLNDIIPNYSGNNEFLNKVL